MTKRTKILLIILCVVVLLLLAWIIWRAQPFSEQTEESTTNATGDVVLSDVEVNITPPYLDEGEAGYLVVKTSDLVKGVEMVFNYDEDAVDLVVEADGDFDEWLTSTAADGTLSVSAVLAPDSDPLSGSDGLAVCKIKVTNWVEDSAELTTSSETCTIATYYGTVGCGDTTILLSKPTANESDLLQPEE